MRRGSDAKKSRRGRVQPVFLSAQQVETLAGELDLQHPYGLLVRFAADTGPRADELTGLRIHIRDLNLKAGDLVVRQTMQHIKGEWVTGAPKSARSTRNVPLVSRALVVELRGYLLAHPHSADPEALVWPGGNPGSHAVTHERVFYVASFRRNSPESPLCVASAWTTACGFTICGTRSRH